MKKLDEDTENYRNCLYEASQNLKGKQSNSYLLIMD